MAMLAALRTCRVQWKHAFPKSHVNGMSQNGRIATPHVAAVSKYVKLFALVPRMRTVQERGPLRATTATVQEAVFGGRLRGPNATRLAAMVFKAESSCAEQPMAAVTSQQHQAESKRASTRTSAAGLPETGALVVPAVAWVCRSVSCPVPVEILLTARVIQAPWTGSSAMTTPAVVGLYRPGPPAAKPVGGVRSSAALFVLAAMKKTAFHQKCL
mmetsp:Transcript_86440/g.152988  ORF Transcript_86440/g.152988 Transcript_86440/m.152988 type:complete len:214 (-) Transcript_86440:2161-2802(-)